MARTPNYSFERSQRERAQRAKGEEKAQRRAEKSARRKARTGEQAPNPDTATPEDKGS
jgi:hypothetical protein